ncbi:hypothetical protein [Stenotrophomonas oahuensis]|uniref:Uncharacterized protein n=1 Tax=Stenotrophomonas oahuensis TaxID=3003271 RepID=A0ABY9YR59_9GAMM|nr:hypothetical protein [Stenotrophomonas sp. A5586]WNH53212.1 hypothetical protein PDM29_02750 [Stenotrophomonas sp. A5586]
MEHYSNLISLLKALNVSYERDDAAPNTGYVKYRGDERVYMEWVPRRLSDITHSGLLDPGFGSGPIDFPDLDYIEVRLKDWVADKPGGGRRDFFDLMRLVESDAELEFRDGCVAWRRR